MRFGANLYGAVMSVFIVVGCTDEKAAPPSRHGAKLVASAHTSSRNLDTGESMVGTDAGEAAIAAGDLSVSLHWCPAGSFTMGRSGDRRSPPVDVTLTHGNWIGRTEVTQGLWKAVMETSPWEGWDGVVESDDHPAVWITWTEANDFCRKLTDRERRARRLTTEWEYRLPTEAEWEYACRAGTTTSFSFGEDESDLSKHSWTHSNARAVGAKHAHAVAAKKPNPWGLCDVHGNVAEWCADVWDPDVDPPGGRDPFVSGEGELRVVRGGSWWDLTQFCQSAHRSGLSRSSAFPTLGFRVVLAPIAKDMSN